MSPFSCPPRPWLWKQALQLLSAFFSWVKKPLVSAVNLNPSLPFLGRTFGSCYPAGAKFLNGEPSGVQLWCFWASEKFILVLNLIAFSCFVLFLNFSFYILSLIAMCLEQRTSSVQELIRYLTWKYRYIVLCNVQKQFFISSKSVPQKSRGHRDSV